MELSGISTHQVKVSTGILFSSLEFRFIASGSSNLAGRSAPAAAPSLFCELSLVIAWCLAAVTGVCPQPITTIAPGPSNSESNLWLKFKWQVIGLNEKCDKCCEHKLSKETTTT